ncbi:MAG: MGMT family protein [Hydrogenovibrio sp.]|nr:MGMT family protein [Hydrogenovibrio sp.]
MSSFNQQCYELLKQVPKGRVTTYKAIAEALGTKAYRAVGNAMNRNPNVGIVPCHRVVGTDGSIGGYVGGTQRKMELLESEGLSIQSGRIVDFEQKCFFPKADEEPD